MSAVYFPTGDDVERLINDMVVDAESYAGAAWDNPRREEYLQACYPLDTKAVRDYSGPRDESCGLFVRGRLQKMRLDDSRVWLSHAQSVGRVNTNLEHMAREAGALFTSKEANLIERGDICLINDLHPNPKRDRAHVFMVTKNTKLSFDQTPVLPSVDGGQGWENHLSIQNRVRYMLYSNNVWFECADEELKKPDRVLHFWVSTRHLIRKFGIRL